MFGSSSWSQRSSASTISPFRSRKSPAPQQATKRPVTPSSTASSRPSSSRSSVSPAAPLATSVSPNSGFSSFSSLQAVNQLDSSNSTENVTVTVRFRPLSPREINKGNEIAWYADGEFTIRNDYNPSIAYGFGTVFAYGVTSSGKTHTMHLFLPSKCREECKPGKYKPAQRGRAEIAWNYSDGCELYKRLLNRITPGREFLVRVSYLEIYNEYANRNLIASGVF